MRKILLIIPLFLFGFKMMMHPEDPKSRDHNSLGFGVAGDVEILDGTFFVGQTGSSLNNGSVYVYNENGESKLDLVEVFPPNNLIYGYSFGHSINTLNDNLLVGSPHRTNAEGKVFLYERSNKEWNLLQELIPAISNVTSNFGSEVVITDKHIFVADQYYDEEKGAVFHFIKDPINNKWKYESIITHADIQEDGYFGHSISVKGDRLLIGSRNGNLAVLYEFNNLIWEEKKKRKLKNIKVRVGMDIQ